jgi:hypothetical protein
MTVSGTHGVTLRPRFSKLTIRYPASPLDAVKH